MLNSKMTNIYDLLMKQAMTLDERLACILQTHQENTFSSDIEVEDVHNLMGMSGYNYWSKGELLGQLHMASLTNGTYVIYTRVNRDEMSSDLYVYYNTKGDKFYTSTELEMDAVSYSSIAMDKSSPFLNHIYNVLHIEYKNVNENFGETDRVKLLEGILNEKLLKKDFHIPANDYRQDQALINIKNEIIRIENDPILKWSERQHIFKSLKEVRAKILATKRRVHRFNFMTYDFVIMLANIVLWLKLLSMRPVNNILGTLYHNTIGRIIWFIENVRKNIGFSIAMAIYGPFTFYFITQPLNPHAMNAVGIVRSTYIDTVNSITAPSVGDKEVMLAKAKKSKEEELVSDNVTVKASSIQNIVSDQKNIKSWDDRMSSFKAMQIAYEGDMVFAARMGRVEQMETQFNFPLTAEAAWMEMELYTKKVQADLDFYKNLDQRYVNFLKKEISRTHELQLYIWQKVGQFFFDHPYMIVDQDNEQTQRNYYVGRQFVFFKKMTKKLQEMGLANSPITHKNIDSLAAHFKKMKQSGSGVLDSLQKNSKLFQQKDFLSTEEHRGYMARQWEILFLQQNKKQEAASFALQTYTWSIKNALWLMQTIYSAKRSELSSMTFKYNLDNSGTQQTMATAEANEYLENMFHNLAMEFVSIKKEMIGNLKSDKEVLLRENVINNLKEYIIERDRLFNTSVYAAISKKSQSI